MRICFRAALGLSVVLAAAKALLTRRNPNNAPPAKATSR